MKRIVQILCIALLLAAAGGTIRSYAGESEGQRIIKEYQGKSVGVLVGSTAEQFTERLFPGSPVYYYESSGDALVALKSGKIDVFLEIEMPIRFMQAENPEIRMVLYDDYVEKAASCFSKTEAGEKLCGEFNDFIRTFIQSGRLKALENKWISADESERVIFDFENLPAIKGVLEIATDPTFPPFEYIKDDRIAGYEAELICLFCKECGYRPHFNYVSFSGLVVGVATQKYDMGIAGLSVTEERKKSVLFSDSYKDNKIAIAFIDSSGSEATGFFDQFKNSFQRTFLTENRWKMFVNGGLVTLEIALFSILFGSLTGFGIYLITRKNGKYAGRIMAVCKEIIQGFPTLVFLMILYYIVFAKSRITAPIVAIIGFSITFTCSVHSILTAGERTVPVGQKEAAYALGYSDAKTFLRYVFPQSALHFLPEYASEAAAHIKATSVVGYLAVVDITKVGDIIRGRTYEAFFPLIAVSLVYFVFSVAVKRIIRGIMNRVDTSRRSEAQILKGLEIK